MHGEVLIPFLPRGCTQGPRTEGRGVVHQNVDRPHGRPGIAPKRLGLIRVCEIGRHRGRMNAVSLREADRCLRVGLGLAVVDYDVCAPFGQAEGNRSSDPPRPAGH